MKSIPFEEKKFCQLSTLSARWECSIDHILDLARKGVIRLWHPEGRVASKGRRAEVASVLEAEEKGYIPPEEIM